RWGVVVLFLQAEDGIRDWSVTGVQTCALPISGTLEIARRWIVGATLLPARPPSASGRARQNANDLIARNPRTGPVPSPAGIDRSSSLAEYDAHSGFLPPAF